jgi:hypothetical protein
LKKEMHVSWLGQGHTTAEKTKARAKTELSAPSCWPTATAKLATVAERDEITPEEMRNFLASHLFSFNLQV